MNSLATIVLLVCLCITGITGYSTKGNKILDPNGNEVLLRGVDRPSMEWSATGQNLALSDYELMAEWGANVVRLTSNQDYWLGLTSASSAAPYQTLMDQQIAWATQAGMGVIIDLHWNIATTGNGQENMADQNSITFWKSVAARYKSNSKVMFELYNEPHDVPWSTWLNGDGTWAGMQQLYDAVRGAGANNLVIVGGLNWAFDLSGVGQGYAVQGTNIAYATHPYDYDGKQLADWPAAFGYLAATYPVIMTEFGQYCNTDTYVADLLTYATENGIHWTAWAWFVSGCSFPSIISDWNGTPISGVGVLVKQYLSGNAPVTTPTGTGSSSSASSGSSSSATSAPVTGASSALTVFSDSLASPWQDWSWATGYSLASTTYVQSGSKSISFPLLSFGGIYLHTTSPFQLGAYSAIQFSVNGGLIAVSSSSLSVLIYGTASSNAQIGNSVPFPASVPASQWSQITIPISSFGVTGSTSISGFAISTNAGSASIGTIYIDNISFIPAATSAATAAPTSAPSTKAPTAAPTKAPTAAPTKAPTAAPTKAPTAAPTKAPTAAPTKAPTAAPTKAPTSAPTKAPTAAPTAAPTKAPTAAPTKAPTAAPTKAPTSAPSTPAPTHAPSTPAPTSAPSTHAPVTSAPTHTPSTTAPSSGCGASSVTVSQTFSNSWPSNGQTVSQYTVEISSSCAGKTLVGLTLAATNWNPIYAWNVNAVASASVSGQATVTLASYAAVTPNNPFSFGYQNIGPQATFTVTSATFQ